jgi:signal transduction histidine kinase
VTIDVHAGASWLVALAAAAAVFLVVAVVFILLWLRALAGRRAQTRLRVAAEQEHFDLRLALDEQTARLRIVRELHEVAIHSVSVIVSQADGAKYAGKKDAAAALRSVEVIADAARSTLADLRRVMTVVQDAEVDAAPPALVASEQDLFALMREAGLTIEFEETGERFELHQGAQLAVYSILQEALGNALKFGGEGTEVRVSFGWSDEGLQVKVDDDGTRAILRRAGLDPNEVAKQREYSVEEDLGALTEVVSGAGMTEMRERAALFGGVFNAYPVPGVGFSVSAVFPALKYHNGIHGVNLDEH